MSDTPSARIIAEAQAERVVTDATGRKLVIRNLDVLAQVRLLRAIGPAQSENRTYVEIVTMAAMVSSIDGIPMPPIGNEKQIDGAISRIGDAGFAAIMVDMKRRVAEVEAAAEAAADAADAEAKPADPLALSAA